jgi:hypothetical protein
MEELNNLKLNGQLLVSLYGRSIVDLSDIGTAHETASESVKTIILFKDNAHAKMPDKQQKFLEQILKACKVDIREAQIINLADKVDLENIIGNGSPAYILSFGTGTGTELFSMKNNRGTKYLNAPDLSELMQETATSKQLKGKLWTELKAMFNL